jgi:hypothetical protein
MKLCSWIQFASDRKRKNDSAKRRMAKKFVVSKSALPALYLFLPIHSSLRAVAARTSAVNNPPPLVSSSSVPPKSKPPMSRKEGKKVLKGVVVVKKKAKLPTSSTKEKDSKPTKDDSLPDAKRRKMDHS